MIALSKTTKPVFKNLDAIRFISFLLVFFSHVFYPRDASVKLSFAYKYITLFTARWGGFGLSMFFVMSGFLITYLLLQERQVYGRVHVLSFYVRRILRIWPIYFLLLLFNFHIYTFVTHNYAFAQHQMPYYFFYANMDVIWHGFNNGVISHLWAISAEEQFYFILPIIMLLVRNKYLHYVFISAIIISQSFRMMHYNEPVVIYCHSISASFEIALGGLAAWLIFFNKKFKTAIASLPKTFIVMVYILSLTLLFFEDDIFNANQNIIALLIFQTFAVFILLEQSYATHSFLKIGKSKWISQLGKYSYGFYCYHILCIRSVEFIAYKLNIGGIIGELIIVPSLSLALTILTGIMSYHFFEIHFLTLKKKFTYLK